MRRRIKLVVNQLNGINVPHSDLNVVRWYDDINNQMYLPLYSTEDEQKSGCCIEMQHCVVKGNQLIYGPMKWGTYMVYELLDVKEN